MQVVKCGNRTIVMCEKDDLCQVISSASKTGKRYRKCVSTGKNVPGKSAYKSKKGYGCTGPYGPPYGHAIKKEGIDDYSGMFRNIEANILADQKLVSCFRRQSTNLFNIMIKNSGLAGKEPASKKKSLSSSPAGRRNLRAYCSVLKTYGKVTGSKRSRSKYCT
jgi:hypothetical protein